MNSYVPSAWGREFHACKVDELLGGGTAGGGKSVVLTTDAFDQIIVEHERCRSGEKEWGRSEGWGLHIRKEFPRLEQTIHRSKLLFPTLDAGAKYDPTAKKWRFSSGYQYQFGHLSESTSYLNYRSNQYTWLGIDELGEIEHKDMYDELALRVRSGDPVLRKMLRVRAMSNPWPNWVRSYFVDPAPEGRKIITKKFRLEDGTIATRSRMFLPARLSDNPDVEFRRQYEASLRDRPAHIRASLLDGNWYVVAGAFYADAWDPSRIVIKPMKIDPRWRRFRAGDWGFKQPCVILWFAVAPDGELICYRERTYNGAKAREKLDAWGVAQRIKEIEKENGEWNHMRDCSRLTGPMDSQLWEERGHRGPTMAHDMARAGVFWVKATKGRRQMAQQILKRLMQRGYNDRAGLLFFESCRMCITTIPAIGTEGDTGADAEMPAKGGPDHWHDAVGYACAYNPVPSGDEDRTVPDEDDYEAPRAARSRGQYGYG